MMRLQASALLGAVLLAACGLTESEQTRLGGLSVGCPELEPGITMIQAWDGAELVVQATSRESYFVDSCHRAFVLDVASVLKGEPPEVILVVIRVDPSAMVESWEDLGVGEAAVLLLERDPDLPEAWRPVSDVSGMVSTDATASFPLE